MTPVELTKFLTSPPVPPKPKAVQIAASNGILYVLIDDGRLFEAHIAIGQWKQVHLPKL